MKSTSWTFSYLSVLCALFDGAFSHPSPSLPATLHERQMGLFNIFGAFTGGSGSMGMGAMTSLMGGGSTVTPTFDTSGAGGCSRYKIISARGAGENQAHPFTTSGFITKVFASVQGGADYEVIYPATEDTGNGPIQGAADALKYMTSQIASCPNQVYLIVGYCTGSLVATQLMNNPQVPASKIAAVVIFGNPAFRGGAPQDACATPGTGIAVSSAMANDLKMSSTYAPLVFDCCKSGDMVCQGTGSFRTHLTYVGSAEEQAGVNFALPKLKAALSSA